MPSESRLWFNNQIYTLTVITSYLLYFSEIKKLGGQFNQIQWKHVLKTNTFIRDGPERNMKSDIF